jgi:glycine betaine/proline transport system substrate-binding protein
VSYSLDPLNAHSRASGRAAESCYPAPCGVKYAALAGLVILGALACWGDARAAVPTEPGSCRVVRMSDVGWTDVTSTTALAAEILKSIGYQPSITVLSVPVTFTSLQNRDVDVFLGNWMPSQEADRKRYMDDGSIEVLGANLSGAKYTLAVPSYTFESGLRDFNDIQRFAGALNHSIYGIEAGNDGNRLVLSMLEQNLYGLHDFHLVESSEQGMLAQVERATKAKQPVVFLAWEPHPMNMRFDLRYLSGGDAVFGANYGGAVIYTVTRKGYAAECPNVGRLLRNLKFSVRGEGEVMDAILNRHETASLAASSWLRSNPASVKAWLDGVLTFEGKPAAELIAQAGADNQPASLEHWITGHKIPVGDAMTVSIDYVKTHGTWLFDAIAVIIRGTVAGVTSALSALPALALIGLATVLAWALRRSLPLAAFVACALVFILNQGYWAATVETLALVIVATLASTLIGVPLGIAAAHRPKVFTALRPVLDLMQTLPTFVYLIPTLVLFGLGVVPGLISTVIFALPAPIRLTHLGISSVPKPLLEAGEAFGATPLQLLWKIELPSASPAIVAGVTQCIMLSLSMVVIAALVGAGGLGVPVVRALNTVQVGMGFEAGFVIVLIAIVLDRISRPKDGGNSR